SRTAVLNCAKAALTCFRSLSETGGGGGGGAGRLVVQRYTLQVPARKVSATSHRIRSRYLLPPPLTSSISARTLVSSKSVLIVFPRFDFWSFAAQGSRP